MKKFIAVATVFVTSAVSAQFRINVEAPAAFTPKEVYLYTLSGSKDVLNTREMRKGNTWNIAVTKPYTGMMKLYFPEQNVSINLVAENKDVRLKFITDQGRVTEVEYLDDTNKLMNDLQDLQQKKEFILPALYQMKAYYQDKTEFGKAINTEINRLSGNSLDAAGHPFVAFYTANYARFVEKSADKKQPTHAEILDFLTKSNDMLETSSLLRPILVSYLNSGNKANLSADVDTMLKVVNTETPRGQTILSELIEIFDAYGMNDLKTKYLTQAENLKCTINDRLAGTIASNKNTEIGAVFPPHTFVQATNTSAKTLADVKAAKKIIVFWSSTCSHCETELPVLLQKYQAMKAQNIEIIGLSLDNDRASYTNKVKDLPWINDTELKGWNSLLAERYNIRATPTYFILDSNNKIIAKPDHAADVLAYLKLN